MTKNSIEDIQEKIQKEKQKIQDKFDKNKEDLEEKDSLKKFVELKNEVKKLDLRPPIYEEEFNDHKTGGKYHYSSPSGIMSGIMVMIIGFTVLSIGSYVINSILSSLNSVDLNKNFDVSYDFGGFGGFIPLFGLAFMVMGFVVILFNLRKNFDEY